MSWVMLEARCFASWVGVPFQWLNLQWTFTDRNTPYTGCTFSSNAFRNLLLIISVNSYSCSCCWPLPVGTAQFSIFRIHFLTPIGPCFSPLHSFHNCSSLITDSNRERYVVWFRFLIDIKSVSQKHVCDVGSLLSLPVLLLHFLLPGHEGKGHSVAAWCHWSSLPVLQTVLPMERGQRLGVRFIGDDVSKVTFCRLA